MGSGISAAASARALRSVTRAGAVLLYTYHTTHSKPSLSLATAQPTNLATRPGSRAVSSGFDLTMQAQQQIGVAKATGLGHDMTARVPIKDAQDDA